ncbi:MAG: hypothetical protein Q7J31_11670 [Syntrophales bacterium]|nr:hypothetical protein [Syntrophales bacterium]
MKKKNLLFLAMAVTIISSCADNSALIRANGTSIRSDVFEELPDGGPVPPGYAALRIVSSLKTHEPDIYSVTDIHGTFAYKLLLNIDGQAVQLQGNLREERINPHGLGDAEAGEGIRYRFSKKLRLKAGTHKVVIAIPTDGIAMEREITLPEGSNTMLLEPVYKATPGKRRPAFYGATSFREGIREFRIVLNGQPL